MTPDAPLSEPLERIIKHLDYALDEDANEAVSYLRALQRQVEELTKQADSAEKDHKREKVRLEFTIAAQRRLLAVDNEFKYKRIRELEQQLADAQARVKALEGLMHRAAVPHVTAERIAEIRHVLGSCSLEADATPTLADEMDAYARQLEQQLKDLEQQRIKYGPICLNCGASKPCMTEEEANKEGAPIPCTFDPAPRELWDRCKQLEQQHAALTARCELLEGALRDAIELGENTIPYKSAFLVKKHGDQAELDRLKQLVGGGGDDAKTASAP